MLVEQELRDRGFRASHGAFARPETDQIQHEVTFDRFRHHGQRVAKVTVGVWHPPTERAQLSLYRAVGVSTVGLSTIHGWIFAQDLGLAPQKTLTFTSPIRNWRGDVSSIAEALDLIAGVQTLHDLRVFYLTPAGARLRPPMFSSCLRQMIVMEFDRQRGGPPAREAELHFLQADWRLPDSEHRSMAERWSVEEMWPLIARAVAG